MRFNPEVEEALKNNKPVVGLESTVLSFGLPYPQNLEAGIEFENIVRENGAIPATVGIVKGEIVIGLNREEIEYFCQSNEIKKCSRRDLPVVIGKKQSGATTVSGTMAILNMAKIKFFATGGLGGVHKGGENSLDISADLREFERSEVCVISSGTKSILDPKRTLEFLETCGVPVIGFKTDDFPLFYSRTSGLKLNARADSYTELSEISKNCFNILNSGLLICNPVPENAEISNDEVNSYLKIAEEDAKKDNISGAAITPYILKKMFELSEGKTLKTNLELLKSNIKVATLISKKFREHR